jgi:hypothetical protein
MVENSDISPTDLIRLPVKNSLGQSGPRCPTQTIHRGSICALALILDRYGRGAVTIARAGYS